MKINCNHYENNCLINSPCCNDYFCCRICHDENALTKNGCKVFQMNRFLIKEVLCKKCGNLQSSESNKCIYAIYYLEKNIAV